MKITFLMGQMTFGGAERSVAYLTKYFAAKKDTEVELIVMNGKSYYDIDPKVKLYLMHGTSSKNLIVKVIRILTKARQLRKHLRDTKPDVIVSFFPRTITYLIGLKRKIKYRLAASERNNPAAVWDSIHMLEAKNAYRTADVVIFQTERAKQFFDESIQKKGVVIPNALGNELVFGFKFEGEREKKVSAIGRLDFQKNYPTMIKAFALVKEKHPDYYLEIYGKGRLREELGALAESLGIGDSVIFRGVTPEAIIKVANASCYVLSSMYEGMPNALMEAMAVGLPCVSTDCPNGPAELIENGKNGLLVPVGDVNALAEAILKMIEDREFAEFCGKNAFKIQETHSLERNAQLYYEAITLKKD